MFFMRFAIDIVFLDKSNRVLRINHRLKPWRVSSMVFGARRALELEAGAAARSGTIEGDQVALRRVTAPLSDIDIRTDSVGFLYILE